MQVFHAYMHVCMECNSVNIFEKNPLFLFNFKNHELIEYALHYLYTVYTTYAIYTIQVE